MIEVLRGVLSVNQCNEIVSFCESVERDTTITTFTDKTVGRHFHNPRGWFHVFRMTPEESKEYCRSIEQAIPGFVVASFRPMLYETGAWLRNHLDMPSNDWEGETTHSLNIMLVDPSEFEGGHFLIGNERRRQIELGQGDAVMYDYSQLHEVKRITKGKRWIINVRLKNA